MKIKKKIKTMKVDEDNPVQTAPKIDKASAVVDLPDKTFCGLVFGNILDLLNTAQPGIIKVAVAGKYQIAVKIHYPDDDGLVHKNSPCVLLQLTNPKMSKRQARIEYNPAHMTEAGEIHLATIFKMLFGVEDFYEFLHHARFTRVDFCQDILMRDLEDYLIKGKWKKMSQCFFGTDGRLQTINLGKSSGSQIVVYNKKAQLYGDDAVGSTIRIEARCRVNLTIGGLAKFKNPFAQVEVYSIRCKKPPFGLAHWRAFQDACRLRGVGNAIKSQPVKNRYALKKVLSTQQVPWWGINDDDWDFLLTEALENAGLLNIPDYAPPLTMKYAVGEAA